MLRSIEERNALFAENKGLVGFVMNEKLAGYWIKDENHTNYSKEDIEQVVCIGLLNACARFDPIKKPDVKFSTYAVQVMMGEWFHWARERTTSIRYPRHVREHFSKINRESSFEKEVKEIMQDTKLTEKEVNDAINYSLNMTVKSLDKPVFADDSEDDLLSTFFGFKQDYSMVEVNAFFDTLPDNEKYIIEQLIQDKGQKEIAAGLGISQAHVSRIIKKRIRPKAAAHFDLVIA
ncbi:RNA polymerase sigma factor [Bacillus phage Stills]|uniref:RNA polymerase sigma factor n=1 Tax=Bacillus phage Stills TaxID=1610833 RepID=A0A0E3T6C4_9CAUD|nr:RNA polymerase sigma factor [Bacillus phage Stills]AKC02694.1 RNA polymerase sigma factor [Bacillus phage Stills]